MKLIEHFVGGKLFSGSSDRKGKVFNPATGEQESEVKLASKSDLDQAVEIAKKAFETWSLKPALQRARVMFKFKELIEKNSDELTKLIVSEHGKVFEDARGSLTRGLEVVEFACGIPHLLKGEFSQNVGTNVDSYSMRQPLGVAAGITPFNFPAMVPMWMFPLAIACGNSFILKPSEKDPSCPMKLAELLHEAGLPEGVFNVVNGDKEVVDAILTNQNIKAVSFVGSTPIAKYIYENAAKNEKRVQALGGAKNHLVVMPDCDLDGAVNGLMGAAYGSAGERCMAQSVAVAVGDIGDELVSRLSKKAEALKIGPGMDKSSEMGPLVTKEHLEKVKGYVDLGVKEGAKLVVDGRSLKLQGYENGFYIGGCLFDHVTKDMRIYKEEIFGPVLGVLTVKNDEEALKIASNSKYGLHASVFTQDINRAFHLAKSLPCGTVSVNTFSEGDIKTPFGGYKQSGSLSRDQGTEALNSFLQTKTIWISHN